MVMGYIRMKEKLRYYIFFCKPAFFISGLIFGHILVEYRVVRMMITYLTANWANASFIKSVIIVNATEGFSSIMVIVLAHIADTYLGRFKIVSFSTVAYVVGLMLLWVRHPANNVGIYLAAAMLIGIGKAGREPPLKAFLADQLRNLSKDKEHVNEVEVRLNKDADNINKDEKRVEARTKRLWSIARANRKRYARLNRDADNIRKDKEHVNKDEKRVEARTEIWWGVGKSVGIVIAIVVLGSSSWVAAFRASTIVMGVALLLFFSGFHYYHHEKLTESPPLTTLFLVIKVAIMKRGLSYSDEPSHYFKIGNGDRLPLAPNNLCSRWLDKAAIIGETPPSAEEQAKKGKLCTVEQVKEVKTLLRMVPLWATFTVYCIIKATGSTFFIEQTTNLDFHIGGSDLEVPIVTLFLIQSFSKYASSFLCDFVISKWFNDIMFLAMKVRVGIGMGCSFLACVIARLVEVRRMQKILRAGIRDNQDATITMSIFWLVPQFCMLGLMEGLAENGLVEIFYYQVAESMKSYGEPFNDFALGIGQFFSIFWVLTFRSWFGDTVNNSDLANYYAILGILSLVNLSFIYGYVSKYVYKDAMGEEENFDIALAEVARGNQSFIRSQSLGLKQNFLEWCCSST